MSKDTPNPAPAEADEQGGNEVDLVDESTAEETLGLPESPEDAFDASLADEEALEDEAEAAEEEGEEDVEEEDPDGEPVSARNDGEEEEAVETEEGEDEEETPARMTPEEIRALYEENRQLLGLKGRQGQALGQRDAEIAELKSTVAKLSAKLDGRDAPGGDEDEVPTTKDEWDALFATDPLRAHELYDHVKEQRRAEREAAEKQEAAQQTAILTPEVGAEVFIRNNKIENFDSWSESKEGVAVRNTIAGSKRMKLALMAAISTGDAEEVASIMEEGLMAVRAKTANGKAKQVSREQARETRESRPKSVPRPGRRVHPAAAKSLMDMSSEDILNMSNAQFAKLMTGR